MISRRPHPPHHNHGARTMGVSDVSRDSMTVRQNDSCGWDRYDWVTAITLMACELVVFLVLYLRVDFIAAIAVLWALMFVKRRIHRYVAHRVRTLARGRP